jgi:ATP-dependent Clp protease protease subunit
VEEIYAEHTGKPKETVSVDLERDRFFTPYEAADYGLIDRVVMDRNSAFRPPSSQARTSGDVTYSSSS